MPIKSIHYQEKRGGPWELWTLRQANTFAEIEASARSLWSDLIEEGHTKSRVKVGEKILCKIKMAIS